MQNFRKSLQFHYADEENYFHFPFDFSTISDDEIVKLYFKNVFEHPKWKMMFQDTLTGSYGSAVNNQVYDRIANAVNADIQRATTSKEGKSYVREYSYLDIGLFYARVLAVDSAIPTTLIPIPDSFIDAMWRSHNSFAQNFFIFFLMIKKKIKKRGYRF